MPPQGYQPIMINPNVDFTEFQKKINVEIPSVNDVLVPFLACGDLSGFDAYTKSIETTEPSQGKQENVQ